MHKTKFLIIFFLSFLILSFFVFPKSVKAQLYALRGNNTTDFYYYSVASNFWSERAPLPLSVGAGGSLVYPGSGDYIYALAGGSTKSFYRYSIYNNSWSSLMDTPVNIGDGGSLAYPNSGDYIYALAGGNTTNFYRYSISSPYWLSLKPIPNNIGAGGDLTYSSDWIALRGGGTTNIFSYNTLFSNWSPVGQDRPLGSVGAGGGIIHYGEYNYILRGDNSRDFYLYSATSCCSPLSSPPNTIGAGGSLSVYNNNIYALRGGDNTDFYVFSSLPLGSWSTEASTPKPIGAGGSLTYGPILPNPPTSLTATIISRSQINLYWTAPTPNGGGAVKSYRIERQDAGGSWSFIKDVATTSYQDSSILPEVQQYNYRVSAVSDTGRGIPVITSVSLVTISLSPESVLLYVGGPSRQLIATVLDHNGNTVGATLTWASNNITVATVDSNGLVSPVGAGTASITASSGGVTSAPSIITVQNLGSVVEYIVDKKLSLSSLSESIYVEKGSKCGLFNISSTDVLIYNVLPASYFSFKTLSRKIIQVTPVSTADLIFSKSDFSDGYISQWVEYSPSSASHIIGVPLANTRYHISVDGNHISGSPFTSDVNGYITFSRTGLGKYEIYTVKPITFPNGVYCSAGTVDSLLPIDPITGVSPSWICKGINTGKEDICTARRTNSARPFVSDMQSWGGYCASQGAGNIFFRWDYNDPSYDLQEKFDFQVDNNSDFTSPEVEKNSVPAIHNSGETNNQQINVTRECNGRACFCSGPGVGECNCCLDYNQTYYWRVKVYDNQGNNSGWVLAPSSFDTADHAWPFPNFEPSPKTAILAGNQAGVKINFKDMSACFNASNALESCTTGDRTYLWDFGGSGSGSPTDTKGDANYTYDSRGKKTINLRVCDGLDCCDTSRDVQIRPPLGAPQWMEISPF